MSVDTNTLCLRLAKNDIRDARVILEKAASTNHQHARLLVNLRKRLELTSDHYLDNRTPQSRKELDGIIHVIRNLAFK